MLQSNSISAELRNTVNTASGSQFRAHLFSYNLASRRLSPGGITARAEDWNPRQEQ